MAKSTEAFIIAAQEQAIRTRYTRAKIDSEDIDYKCRLCDFAVPWDTNIETTEAEKVSKYAPLANNIQKLHKVRTRRIPVVVGSLGTIPKKLKDSLKDLDIPDVIGSLQTSALIGTANILRRTLNL